MHTQTPLDPHHLGLTIAGLRRAQGLSQRRLAEAAGVSHGYIALLELGRMPSPSKARLDAVARALELRTADALLGEDLPTGDAPSSPTAAPPSSSPSPSRSPSGAAQDAERAARPLRILSSTPPAAAPPGVLNDATAETGSSLGNVVGNVDQLRSASARPLPVFRWGSCGDPRDRDCPPDPDHLEFPPPGRESLIGSGGFGVMVKGDSMAARGIFDGDVVWVNPERAYAFGKVVLALVTHLAGDTGMVVKTYARTDIGECLMSETLEGRTAVVCKEFKVIGPVVGITSWRLPN